MSSGIMDSLFRLFEADPPWARRGIRPPLLYRKLVAEFIRPNAAGAVARRRREGHLPAEPKNAPAPHWHGRDESGLRLLCLRNGLQPRGSAEELVDRLLALDPSGGLFDYPREFPQCVEQARVNPGQSNVHATLSRETRSVDEVNWEMLKEYAQRTAREGNLTHCRNVHVAMAVHLLRRNKQGSALRVLCIACTFDLCGVRNRNEAPAEAGCRYSGFDATRAALNYPLIRRLRSLAREMALSIEEIRSIFVRVSSRLPIPTSPEALWPILRTALQESVYPGRGAIAAPGPP